LAVTTDKLLLYVNCHDKALWLSIYYAEFRLLVFISFSLLIVTVNSILATEGHCLLSAWYKSLDLIDRLTGTHVLQRLMKMLVRWRKRRFCIESILWELIPYFGTLSRRVLNPIKQAYSPSGLDGWLCSLC